MEVDVDLRGEAAVACGRRCDVHDSGADTDDRRQLLAVRGRYWAAGSIRPDTGLPNRDRERGAGHSRTVRTTAGEGNQGDRDCHSAPYVDARHVNLPWRTCASRLARAGLRAMSMLTVCQAGRHKKVGATESAVSCAMRNHRRLAALAGIWCLPLLVCGVALL